MAGTEGTAVRARPAAQGGTEEAAAQAKGSLLEREGAPPVPTGGVLLEGVGMKVEGVVAVRGVGEEGVIKDKTAPPVVVTTIALRTPPSALSPGHPAQRAAAPSSWRV